MITGGSSGIGAQAAKLFAAEGARLALIARGPEALAAAASSVHGETHVFPADVADRPALERAVEAARSALGGIDVLVTNAGASAYGSASQVPAADVERTVAVTFGGAVNAVRAALPHLRASHGIVVACVSITSAVPTPYLSAYASAKAALRGFLGSLRVELDHERAGVRICMVHPGPVDTPFWRRLDARGGRVAALPPGAYRGEDAALALVDAVLHPVAERGVGAADGLVMRLFDALGPALDAPAVMYARWSERLAVPATEPSILWRPSGPEQLTRPGGGRASVWARVRTRARRSDG